MLFTVILVEFLLVAGMAVAVLSDEKKMTADFNKWLGVKKTFVYRIPLHLVICEEIKEAVVEVQRGARHRYVQI